MSAALIFGLLFGLMLTGMPISISLGLTVLTFLFTMTEVPIESVGLKLFSGLDNFGIMAIPFFILAGTFLTRGGVARRMIAFTTSLVGHLPGGLGLAGVAACAMLALVGGALTHPPASATYHTLSAAGPSAGFAGDAIVVFRPDASEATIAAAMSASHVEGVRSDVQPSHSGGTVG